MSAKIGYRVIFASSKDNGHDVQELEIRNNIDRESITSISSNSNNKIKNKGKGWQSARFCDYPQDLVIGLDGICEICQIQILSHQSKIASKVEIWIGSDNNNHNYSTYKSINWKRLGYLSLDKNERSNWKARELKSVYINTTANYIKFSLHESHINTINLFNQIGIVALTILGKIINNNYNNNNDALISVNDENNNVNNTNIDEATSNKIRELMILKKQAVQNEDYDEAKRCKICIEKLQNSAKELFHLEQQKQIAVQKEDYDTAKALKLQIDRLRNMSLNSNNNIQNIQHMQSQSQSQSQSHSRAQSANIHNMNMIEPMQTNHNSVQFAAPPPIHQQQQQQYIQNQNQAPVIPIAMANQPQPQIQQRIAHSHSHSMSPRNNNNNMNISSLSNPDDRQIRPMQRNYNTIDVSNANPFNNMNNESITIQPNQTQQKQQQPKASNGERPPMLKASVKKGSEKLIEMFGEYTITLLHSPNWSHRDEGLKKVNDFLNNKEFPDHKQVFKLTCKIIYLSLQDRVPQIKLSGINTINTLINVYNNDSQCDMKCLHSLIIILVNILGNNNNRLIDGAGSILISLCHYNTQICKTIYQILTKKMRKELPKHLKGRGLILLQLIPQFNVPKGVDLSVLMDNLIKPQLVNKNGNIRDIGIQIICLLYQIVEIRNHMVRYLENANLNDFLKETLNNSFQEVSGHSNVLHREPKSIKEQSRPSKTMNRNTNATKPKKKPQPKRKRKKKKQIVNNNNDRKQQPQQQQENMHDNNNNTNESEDVCNFCGLRDISFVQNEENLDLHYWQSCPMLTSCTLCEQVIEIATLHEHILTECESQIKHEICRKCNIPYPMNSNNGGKPHKCAENINLSLPICPLCLNNIQSSSNDAWKQHLLSYGGCKSNPRPLLQ